MSGAKQRDTTCSVKWCDETGEHTVHRLYLASIPAESARWTLGVNVARPKGSVTAVELTAVPRRGRSAEILLGTREAELLRDAMAEAVDRLRRRRSRNDV